MANVTHTSWVAEEAEEEPSLWENSEDPRLDHKEIREMNKRFRTIYEESGMEYGDDVGQIELAKRYKVAADLRKTHIKGVLKSIRAGKNVEVCFLVDATGSMQDHIDGVTKSVNKLADLLKQPKSAPNTTRSLRSNSRAGIIIKLRLSMVAYRDFGDADQFEILPFTESVEKLKAFCDKIMADGGEDEAEDVFGAFQQALNLGWSDECGTKVIFHITDSPCHGKRYHSMKDDRYPDGDPNSVTEAKIFKDLQKKGIDYYFGAVVAKNTDQMIQMFSKAYGKQITQFDVNKVQAITHSVFTAVSTSIFFSENQEFAQNTRTYDLDPKLPSWPKINSLSGRFLSFKLPTSIKDIINNVSLERNQPRKSIVKVAPNPFAHGSERYAFFGLDVTTPSKPENIVLKECIIINSGNPAARYECTNQVQTIASFLAGKYNAATRQNDGLHFIIKFLKVKTLYLPISETENRYFSCEKRFGKDEKFIRFTNNADYEMMSEAAENQNIDIKVVWALTAFSHWTFQVTNGYLMVVDLQGVITKEKYNDDVAILTDPAIHCTDETRFGRMNLGKKGIKIFFQRHKCNEYCEALKLIPIINRGESEGGKSGPKKKAESSDSDVEILEDEAPKKKNRQMEEEPETPPPQPTSAPPRRASALKAAAYLQNVAATRMAVIKNAQQSDDESSSSSEEDAPKSKYRRIEFCDDED